MPRNGPCTNITCDNEIKELYECHCCLRLVCLYHLNKHVEIEKKSKQRSDTFRNELNTMVNTLQEILEEKQLTINREQNLIEQTKQFLDEPNISIDELQGIFEKIHQAILSNHSEITVKVEPSLSETQYCSCAGKYNKENMNPNGGVLYLEDTNHDFIDLVSDDETTKSIQDEHVNEEKVKHKRKSFKKTIGKCPLTFDGAYGLTKANHSVEFCKHNTTRLLTLHLHFMNKHKLKSAHSQRLIRAVVANQDPRKTKLFHRNENVINCFDNVPCPFFSGQMNSSNYTRQNETTMLCQLRLVSLNVFKRHLQRRHDISDSLAQKLFDDFKKSRTK
ncbi:unnamed protein product [Rotaria sp. Silwood2]|nr:unnamed protein product [Rotaria sp. Silwood2]